MLVSDWPLYRYRGHVERIVDGDTLSVLLDLGDRTYRKRRIRLLGYNAPELFSGEDREEGAAARDALAALIPVGSTVYIETKLDRESFDRLLGHCFIAQENGRLADIAELMIAAGHGLGVDS